jgi:hypothetical protein
MPAQYPQRQRFIYSRKSFSLLQGSELFAGLISMSVDVSIDGADPLYGTGMTPYGEPRGELKVEGEFVFVAEAFFDFVKGHPQFLVERFDFSGVFLEGSRTDAVGLKTVRLLGAAVPVEGTEGTQVTVKYRAYDFLVGVEGGALASVIDSDALGANADAGAA